MLDGGICDVRACAGARNPSPHREDESSNLNPARLGVFRRINMKTPTSSDGLCSEQRKSKDGAQPHSRIRCGHNSQPAPKGRRHSAAEGKTLIFFC